MIVFRNSATNKLYSSKDKAITALHDDISSLGFDPATKSYTAPNGDVVFAYTDSRGRRNSLTIEAVTVL